MVYMVNVVLCGNWNPLNHLTFPNTLKHHHSAQVAIMSWSTCENVLVAVFLGHVPWCITQHGRHLGCIVVFNSSRVKGLSTIALEKWQEQCRSQWAQSKVWQVNAVLWSLALAIYLYATNCDCDNLQNCHSNSSLEQHLLRSMIGRRGRSPLTVCVCCCVVVMEKVCVCTCMCVRVCTHIDVISPPLLNISSKHKVTMDKVVLYWGVLYHTLGQCVQEHNAVLLCSQLKSSQWFAFQASPLKHHQHTAHIGSCISQNQTHLEIT